MSYAVPEAVARLEFDPQRLTVGDDTDIRQGLSAVVLHEANIWLACDEGCRLERLSQSDTFGLSFAAHAVFPLADLLALPATSDEEADIEGLDIDDGWLWLVGSHSVKRKRPKKNDEPAEAAARLAKTERDGNRHLLARIPLEGNVPKRHTGSRRSGSISTSPASSALLEAIIEHDDPHLAPFVDVPGTDNGLDIEGLAVRGMRAFVGLRGPVLREWCCILELKLDADEHGALHLVPLDGTRPYRKHFLKLGALGVRDLVWLEDDLLVLAGPSMAHDGPSEIWRWKNGAKVRASGTSTDTKRLLALPHGEGTDRAEGLSLFSQGGSSTLVLVVFDRPGPARLAGESSVWADVYKLP